MATAKMRKIVTIDEDKCNGCGLCIPNCAEGAIRIIEGKARLVAENLCDGLGACLGHCPMDAIHVQERPAEEFDEHAVAAHLAREKAAQAPAAHAEAAAADQGQCAGDHGRGMGGCPGSRMRMLDRVPRAAAPAGQGQPRPSQLGQWPVQLALVPVGGPMWQDADVLIAADCVPFACADFHEKLLAGKSLAIACPKLDDLEPYVEKLTAILANNTVRSITVAHMEVPCCSGIVWAVKTALEQSGRGDLEMKDVTIGVDGQVRANAFQW